MQKHRYKVSFFLTTLFYVLLVFGYIFYIKNHHFSAEQKPKEEPIILTLSQFIPLVEEIIEPISEPVTEEPELEPEQKIEEPIVEEIEPEPEVEEEKPKLEEKKKPEPPIQEEPLIEPEPVIEKPVVKPKPVVKKPKKIKKRVKKKKLKKKFRKKKKSIKHQKSSVRKAVKRNLAKKNQFLARLRAKINRAKSYPRIAQKRGMQGVVKVRFVILANGRVSNISVSGPKVFYRSARSAVKSAFPISTKNASFTLPTTVNLTLRYQLR